MQRTRRAQPPPPQRGQHRHPAQKPPSLPPIKRPSPIMILLVSFIAWKTLMMSIAIGSSAAGRAYDTSTSLFFEVAHGAGRPVHYLAERLTRWDAIYFTHAAREGYVYEQEWAFGTGMALAIRKLSDGVRWTGLIPPEADVATEAVVGIAFANVSHFYAVMAMYKLTMVLSSNQKMAMLSGLLFIVSPAGMFMCAPVSESSFAHWSLYASWLFASSYHDPAGSWSRSVGIVFAGMVFGLATAFRSNGLANGLLFAVEALRHVPNFFKGPSMPRFWAVASPVLGGIFVALGSFVPQYYAWKTYCGGPEGHLRPWCENTIPSISTYVQDVYWDVGFLRYWTVNQIPLFILAAPMLTILFTSSYQVLKNPSRALQCPTSAEDEHRLFIRVLAISQGVVAFLALTSYHVQIITRLSSGYAVWYWWVASCLSDPKKVGTGRAVVTFMVMYACIQGALFASFLPPA